MTDHIPTEFEVELVSGNYLDVTQPDPTVLSLRDISIPLAKDCRYGGACDGFYSVAEHAVLVASKLQRIGAPVNLQLAGLHHDDAECILKDIQRPVKLALRARGSMDGYSELTRLFDQAVCRRFATVVAGPPLWTVDDLHHPLVKEVDNWACAFEASRIMPSRGKHWEQVWMLKSATRPIPEDHHDKILGLEWRNAAWRWENWHGMLVDQARGVTGLADLYA